jgi:hypothetical protein
MRELTKRENEIAALLKSGISKKKLQTKFFLLKLNHFTNTFTGCEKLSMYVHIFKC